MSEAEFCALVQKMRAAQHLPAAPRRFYRPGDREACEALEQAVDQAIVRYHERQEDATDALAPE